MFRGWYYMYIRIMTKTRHEMIMTLNVLIYQIHVTLIVQGFICHYSSPQGEHGGNNDSSSWVFIKIPDNELDKEIWNITNKPNNYISLDLVKQYCYRFFDSFILYLKTVGVAFFLKQIRWNSTFLRHLKIRFIIFQKRSAFEYHHSNSIRSDFRISSDFLFSQNVSLKRTISWCFQWSNKNEP